VTFGTIGVTVVLAWLFLVHVGLFHYARRWRRAKPDRNSSPTGA
jgi:hypothetical protein